MGDSEMKEIITRFTRARKMRLQAELEDKSVETYLIKLGTLFATPKGFVLSLIFGGIAYFSPIWMVVLVICIFVVVDFITGIMASRKLKIPVKSKNMRATVTKLLCYFITIILAFFIQKEIIKYDWFEIMNVSAGFIVLAEFKSVLENFGVLTNNKIFANIFKIINDAFKKKTDVENNDQNS
jgi:phage-related holin